VIRALCIVIFLSNQLVAQVGLFVNGPDAGLWVPANSTLSVHGSFNNLDCDPITKVRVAGVLQCSEDIVNHDSLVFSATQTGPNQALTILNEGTDTLQIIGSVRVNFWALTINRSNKPVVLHQNITVRDTIHFLNGYVFLNQHHLYLQEPTGVPLVVNHPWIKNEGYQAGIRTLGLNDTGSVYYNGIATSSTALDCGNIGVRFKGMIQIGNSIHVKRQHAIQFFAGKCSMPLFFDVTGDALVASDSVIIHYNYHQLSMLSNTVITYAALSPFVSDGSDAWWHPLKMGPSTVRVNGTSHMNGSFIAAMNTMTTPLAQITPTLFRITLADPSCDAYPFSLSSPDTLHLCQSQSFTLDAGSVSSVPNTPLRYEWSQPQLYYTQTLSVSSNQTFQKIGVSIVDIKGCLTKDSTVVAPTAPNPVIQYFNHLNACEGDSVILKDTVTISSGQFTVNLFLSNNQQHYNVGHRVGVLLSPPGTYAAQLQAISNYGCKSIQTRTNLEVYPLPTASFQSSLNCSSHQIILNSNSFAGNSGLTLTSHHWQMHNASMQGSVVGVTASLSGQYSVNLTVQDNAGCKDSVQGSFIVPLHNSLSAQLFNRCKGDTALLNFNGQCAYPPCQVWWNPGDGNILNGSTVNKIYSSSGQKLIKLYVQGQQGCVDSLLQLYTINALPTATLSSSQSTFCVGEMALLSATTAITQGSISNYLWNGLAGGPIYTVAAGLGSNTFQLQLVSDSGCVNRVSTTFSGFPVPMASAQLNNHCRGDSALFFYNGLSSNGLQFNWQYGNFFQSGWTNQVLYKHLFPASGNYQVKQVVQNVFGCKDSISVPISVFQPPLAVFNGSVSTCGSQYTLDAQNIGSQFQWWPMISNQQTVTALTPGWVGVTITSTLGCQLKDSMFLSLNQIVKPWLGPDKSHCGPLVLKPNSPYATYQWNTGATTSSIQASNSGTYILTVTDQNNCMGSDTVLVQILSPASLFLGTDTILCKPRNGYTVQASTNATLVHWNDLFVGASRIINETGVYIATATYTNGCEAKDTLTVIFKTTPQIQLLSNYYSCETVLIPVNFPGYIIQWSTGDTKPWLLTDTSGSFYLMVTHPLTGCSDTAQLTAWVYSKPEINLGSDTTICNNTGYWLTTNNFTDQVQWMNGVNAPSLYAELPGIYSATLTNSWGCSAQDDIHIMSKPAPVIEMGPPIRYICGESPVIITSNQVLDWRFNDKSIGSFSALPAQQAGIYECSYSENGCISHSVIEVHTANDTLSADFLVATRDTIHQDIKFVCLTQPLPSAVEWDFGDGTSSTELHPVHRYLTPGDFSVTLTVFNAQCEATSIKSLNALFRKMNRRMDHTSGSILYFEIYPNPNQGQFDCWLKLTYKARVEFSIMDATGRLIYSKWHDGVEEFISPVEDVTIIPGLYWVSVSVQGRHGLEHQTKRLLVQ